MILNPHEARVLACLIEKSVTTPEYYPLTLNSLTAACNQKSNRDPVLQLGEKDVVRALDTLHDKKLAWTVTVTGSRVPKYRHSVVDVLPLTPPQLAVLCELMLRTPQTASELRMHAARLAAFANGNEVQLILQQLAEWAGGALVARIPRQPGQREERYAHLLGGEIPAVEVKPAGPPVEEARRTVMAENERIAALETRIAAMGDELERLKAQFADFIKQFQ